MSANGVVLDLEVGRLNNTFSELDDETLVFAMLGLLEPGIAGRGIVAGASATAGIAARAAFMEIGGRWIPLDVFTAALSQTIQDDDDAC